MYERYWQLDRAPFDHDRRPESFYDASLHGQALVKLRYLIEHGKGAASLFGASGTGKTHILEMLRHQLASQRPIVHVLYPQLTPHELVAEICHSLGTPHLNAHSELVGLDVLLRAFEARLQELTEAGREPVIIIDDAHLIEDRRVFQTLHQLMNFQQPGRSNFSLILAGQPELMGTLQVTEQFADRLAFHCLVQSLSQSETTEYVTFRLKAVGRETPIFDRQAMKSIYELSAGIPRRINRLCDFALLVGYANQAQQILAEDIEGVHFEITRTNLAA